MAENSELIPVADPRVAVPLRLGQAAWDLFFRRTLRCFAEPNPDLRRDRALDRTIRALGQRPKRTPSARELEEGMLRIEVELLIAASAQVRNHGRCVIPRAVDGRAL